MPQAIIFLEDQPDGDGVKAVARFDPEIREGKPLSDAQSMGIHLFEVAQRQGVVLSDQAVQWLATGHRCPASNALFSALTGVAACQPWGRFCRIWNVQDFKSCQRLLDAVPELDGHLDKAAGISPEWANIVACWKLILGTLEDEDTGWGLPQNAGRYRPTPKTAQLIANISRGVDL